MVKSRTVELQFKMIKVLIIDDLNVKVSSGKGGFVDLTNFVFHIRVLFA